MGRALESHDHRPPAYPRSEKAHDRAGPIRAALSGSVTAWSRETSEVEMQIEVRGSVLCIPGLSFTCEGLLVRPRPAGEANR